MVNSLEHRCRPLPATRAATTSSLRLKVSLGATLAVAMVGLDTTPLTAHRSTTKTADRPTAGKKVRRLLARKMEGRLTARKTVGRPTEDKTEAHLNRTGVAPRAMTAATSAD